MHQPFPDESVRLVLTEDIRVAVLAHHGDPRRLGDTLRRFIDWRRRHRLPPGSSATYNLLYGDPERVPPEAFRLDLCVAVRRPLGADGEGLADGLIPGGRCAVLRHVGDERGLAEAIRGLCEVWLPRSGEHRRDFPVYLQRLSFYPEVPEREAATDIFLPLHPLPSASA